MPDLLKALAFCLLAQALLVARQRLLPVYFGSLGVLALTALAGVGFGTMLLAATWSQAKSMLKPKPLLLAALTALFGVALTETLSLAGREHTTAAAVQLSSYAIPLAVLLVAVVTKVEALDKWTLVALLAGIAAVTLGTAGTDTAEELITSRDGLFYLLAAAGSTACFLAAGQRLLQASSLPFAVASTMILGGAILGYLAQDQLPSTLSDARSATGGLVGLFTYAALGLAAVYAFTFAALARVKLTAVGAGFLLAAPCSVLYLYFVQGREPSQLALAGAAGALVACGAVFARAKS